MNPIPAKAQADTKSKQTILIHNPKEASKSYLITKAKPCWITS
jgi:hypothetical protein